MTFIEFTPLFDNNGREYRCGKLLILTFHLIDIALLVFVIYVFLSKDCNAEYSNECLLIFFMECFSFWNVFPILLQLIFDQNLNDILKWIIVNFLLGFCIYIIFIISLISLGVNNNNELNSNKILIIYYICGVYHSLRCFIFCLFLIKYYRIRFFVQENIQAILV